MSDSSPAGSGPSRSVPETGLIIALTLLLLGQAVMAGATVVQIVEEIRAVRAGD